MSHAVLTGPIRGRVTLVDGTEVDVSASVVMVETPEQSSEIAHLIGERYEAEGHPDFIPEPHADFVHVAAPEFADYEPHEAMTAHLDRVREANPDLAARVALQRPDVEAAAAAALAAPAEDADTTSKEG